MFTVLEIMPVLEILYSAAEGGFARNSPLNTTDDHHSCRKADQIRLHRADQESEEVKSRNPL